MKRYNKKFDDKNRPIEMTEENDQGEITIYKTRYFDNGLVQDTSCDDHIIDINIRDEEGRSFIYIQFRKDGTKFIERYCIYDNNNDEKETLDITYNKKGVMIVSCWCINQQGSMMTEIVFNWDGSIRSEYPKDPTEEIIALTKEKNNYQKLYQRFTKNSPKFIIDEDLFENPDFYNEEDDQDKEDVEDERESDWGYEDEQKGRSCPYCSDNLIDLGGAWKCYSCGAFFPY